MAISIKNYLEISELEQRYRKTKDVVLRGHYQVICQLAKGKTTREVADNVGLCADWVRKIARRYNRDGPDGLGDRRHNNRGQQALLSGEEQRCLGQALRGPAPDGGMWSGPKVAKWIEENTGRKVYPQRGWEYLKRLGFRLRRPRPKHKKADPDKQEAFKKNCPNDLKT